jgi:hypothetical protein
MLGTGDGEHGQSPEAPCCGAHSDLIFIAIIAGLIWTLGQLPLVHMVSASFAGFIGIGLQLPLAPPRFRFRRQPAPVDVVVLIGDNATTLVVEALITAGMVRHVAFSSPTARHLQPHTGSQTIRVQTWEAVAETVRGLERYIVVAQEGFVSSDVRLTDGLLRSVAVIDAGSLIVSSVRGSKVSASQSVKQSWHWGSRLWHRLSSSSKNRQGTNIIR